MSRIKYKKGDIIKEVWDSDEDEVYIFKVIKDIPLKLWKNRDSYIGKEYVRCIETRNTPSAWSMENEYSVIMNNLKQYKVLYMNTALYKILHKGELNE